VAETAAVHGAMGVRRNKAARSFVLVKARKKSKKESPERERVPDPRGRGREVDLRI
jgi:hypothetical protein